MRVIAGELKGRRLRSPEGRDVRPTTDKVKEAVFSMLLPYMEEGFTAIDLFAGSGGLGIEAISRGAGLVYFSDSSRDSIALVKENLAHCNVLEKGVLLLGDFKSNIKRIRGRADVVFMDPPYADGFLLPALDALDARDSVAPGGAVVCEHSKREELPDEYAGFRKVRDRLYGSIAVTIYEREAEDDA
ncbi:MAG: 16S rRNA (guanine(966)-N(2))-methyltransferase RsmD [Firmicutes bacterium]|nr:16S rRNA (guanine(966)-N(2))-methyltransferase RsmD [Bacillota bacterium]